MQNTIDQKLTAHSQLGSAGGEYSYKIFEEDGTTLVHDSGEPKKNEIIVLGQFLRYPELNAVLKTGSYGLHKAPGIFLATTFSLSSLVECSSGGHVTELIEDSAERITYKFSLVGTYRNGDIEAGSGSPITFDTVGLGVKTLYPTGTPVYPAAKTLIKDGLGDPTTITLLFRQLIEVTYSWYVSFKKVISVPVVTTPIGDYEFRLVITDTTKVIPDFGTNSQTIVATGLINNNFPAPLAKITMTTSHINYTTGASSSTLRIGFNAGGVTQVTNGADVGGGWREFSTGGTTTVLKCMPYDLQIKDTSPDVPQWYRVTLTINLLGESALIEPELPTP